MLIETSTSKRHAVSLLHAYASQSGNINENTGIDKHCNAKAEKSSRLQNIEGSFCCTVGNFEKFCLQIIRWLAGELDFGGIDVLADGPVVDSHGGSAGVNLLRVHAVLGVEVLHLAVGEDAVELVLDFELGPQLGAQR